MAGFSSNVRMAKHLCIVAAAVIKLSRHDQDKLHPYAQQSSGGQQQLRTLNFGADRRPKESTCTVYVKLLIPDHAQEGVIVGVEWHIAKCAVTIYFSQSSRGLISRFA